MKVKELVAKLQKVNQETEVVIWDGEGSYVDPSVGKAEVVESHGELVDDHPAVEDGINKRKVVVISIDT